MVEHSVVKGLKKDEIVPLFSNILEILFLFIILANEDNGFVKSCTNAYMLVYIRKELLSDILRPVAETEIPTTLAQRFTDEREIENIKRKERAEMHMFMSVTVITDEQFDGHQGHGLLDPDCVQFRVLKVECFTKRDFYSCCQKGPKNMSSLF